MVTQGASPEAQGECIHSLSRLTRLCGYRPLGERAGPLLSCRNSEINKTGALTFNTPCLHRRKNDGRVITLLFLLKNGASEEG